MQQLHPNLWISDGPMRFFGVEMGSRMTIIRLPDNTLMLHSPIAADEALVAEVKALGDVAYLVAPNRFHHLFVDQWQAVCPDAQTFIAPGLDTKRPDLSHTGVLTDVPEPGWAGVVDQVAFGGIPMMGEVVFFHRESATLIFTDCAFNIGPESPALTRFAFRMGGAYDTLAPTHMERLLVRDKAAFRRSLERVLEWPFERVVVAHGRVSESGGREELLRGYAWALK